MKFGYEEILMVVIAFLIGWFLKTMMTSRLIEGAGTQGNKINGGTEWKWPTCHSDTKFHGYDENFSPCSKTRRLEGQECRNPWGWDGEIDCEGGTECNDYDVPVIHWDTRHHSSGGGHDAWSPSGVIVGTCEKTE